MPRGTQKGANEEPNGAKRVPKGAKRVPKGAKRESKGAKRVPKGAKREPNGSQRAAKGAKREPKGDPNPSQNQHSGKVAKKEPKLSQNMRISRPFLTPKSLKFQPKSEAKFKVEKRLFFIKNCLNSMVNLYINYMYFLCFRRVRIFEKTLFYCRKTVFFEDRAIPKTKKNDLKI